jgi:hypothetical protein
MSEKQIRIDTNKLKNLIGDFSKRYIANPSLAFNHMILISDTLKKGSTIQKIFDQLEEAEKRVYGMYGINMDVNQTLVSKLRNYDVMYKVTSIDEIEKEIVDPFYEALRSNPVIDATFDSFADEILTAFEEVIKKASKIFQDTILKKLDKKTIDDLTKLVVNKSNVKVTVDIMYRFVKFFLVYSGLETLILDPKKFANLFKVAIGFFRRSHGKKDPVINDEAELIGINMYEDNENEFGGFSVPAPIKKLSNKIKNAFDNIKMNFPSAISATIKMFVVTYIGTLYFMHRIITDYKGDKRKIFGGRCPVC